MEITPEIERRARFLANEEGFTYEDALAIELRALELEAEYESEK